MSHPCFALFFSTGMHRFGTENIERNWKNQWFSLDLIKSNQTSSRIKSYERCSGSTWGPDGRYANFHGKSLRATDDLRCSTSTANVAEVEHVLHKEVGCSASLPLERRGRSEGWLTGHERMRDGWHIHDIAFSPDDGVRDVSCKTNSRTPWMI